MKDDEKYQGFSLQDIIAESNYENSIRTKPDEDDTGDFDPPAAKPKKAARAVGDEGKITVDEVGFSIDQDFRDVFDSAKRDAEILPEEPEDEAPPKRARRVREPVPEPTLPESPREAAAALPKYLRTLTYRLLTACAFTFVLIYFATAHKFNLPMPNAFNFLEHPYSYIFMSFALQLIVMLCGIDVITRGVRAAAAKRCTMETGIAAQCAATALHVFSIFLFNGTWGAYLPYCAVSGVLVTGAMFAARFKAHAKLRTYKAADLAEYNITVEDRLYTDTAGITKQRAPLSGFVRRVEARDSADKLYSLLVPLLFLAAVLLAFVASWGRLKNFFWAFAAISSVVVPLPALFAFALPFNSIAKRLRRSGSAIAGAPAVKQIGKASVTVVTDRDMVGMASYEGLKVFGIKLDRAAVYAASIFTAAGTALADVFEPSLRELKETVRTVRDLEICENGFSGYIGGDIVHIGSKPFVISRGVRVPPDANVKDAVFMSVNNDLAALFAIKYHPSADMSECVNDLVKWGVKPLFAMRDYNISPTQIKECFKIKDADIDYPVVEDRMTLSDPDRKIAAKTAACVSQPGIEAYSEAVVGAVRLGRASSMNLLLSGIWTFLGVGFVFYMTSVVSGGSEITPGNVLLFEAVGMLITSLISGWTSRD